MRAYLRLDPQLADKKAAYPDGAHRAFIDLLCFAEQQPQRGRFRNRRLLAVLLERRAKWIPYLVEHGDLIELSGGRLYVDGWDEWQEGDWKVSERVARIRHRKTVTPTVTDAVTDGVTDGVTPTVSNLLGGGGGGRPLPAEAANRSDGTPATFMGFRPRKTRKPTEAEILADIRRQHEESLEITRRVARGEHPKKEGQP